MCIIFSQKVFASENGDIHSLVISTLDSTQNSQQVVYSLMCDNKLYGYTNKKGNQHAYYSESLNRSQFNNLLDNAFSSSTEKDINFFYFTGHTIFEDDDPPTNPLGINLNVSTTEYYSFKNLAQKLNSYKGKMIVILDTCGSEAFIQDGISTLSDKSHIYAICSCGYLQESEFGRGIFNPTLFFHGYKYNAFTYTLGKGLGFFNTDKKLLADSNSNGVVSLNELYQYIKSNIKTVHEVMDVKVYPQKSSLNIFSYKEVKVTSSIKLSRSKLTCYVSAKKQLKVSGISTNTKVKWKSSNSKVATVNAKGGVEAKKAGECTITATINKKTLKCSVVVLDPSIKLSKKSITITVGNSKTLKATVKGISSKVKWKSSNKKIATVDSNGKVTGKKSGTCIIQAKANGKIKKCKVTVKKKTSSAKYLKAIKRYRSILNSTYVSKFTVKDILGDGIPELLSCYYDVNMKKTYISLCIYDPNYIEPISDGGYGNYIIEVSGDAVYVNKHSKTLIEYENNTYMNRVDYNIYSFTGEYIGSYHYDKDDKSCSKYTSSNNTVTSISKNTFNKEVNSYIKKAVKYTKKDAKYTNNKTNRTKYLK
jgi:hypothetical protein